MRYTPSDSIQFLSLPSLEEEDIQESLDQGEITNEEARERHRELKGDDWESVRESAQLARDLMIGDW